MRPRRVDPEDDRGATLVIVILAMTAIFGMVALSIDGGGIVALRRRLVNTSDSAALSAALAFAKNLSACDNSGTWGPAQTWATGAAAGNEENPGLQRVQFTTTCTSASTGTVTVKYEAPMKFYFAPVLGFDSNKLVGATATAAFGVAGSGQPPPLMLRSGPLKDCWGGSYTPPPTATAASPVSCSLWLNNSTDDLTQLGNAQWAWVNLDKWGVAATDNCSNAGSSKTQNWITNGYPNQLGFNTSGPTYVCTENGNARPQARALASLVGQIRWFPVNCETQVSGSPCSAPHGQIDKNGALCAPPSCTPDKYDIVGYEPLRIVHVCSKGDDCWGAALGTAPVTADPGVSNTTCDAVKNFAITNPVGQVNVLSLNATGCPPTGRAGVIINNDLVQAYQNGSGNPPTKFFCTPGYVPGVPSAFDYGYDPSTHLLTWNPNRINTNCGSGSGGSSKHVTFVWHVDPVTGSPGTPGYCNRFGVEDSNAWCLSVQYEGPQAGNGDAGGGYDFGARGINLVSNPSNP